MGVVHLAQGPDGRRVALKVLRPHIVGDVEARERLAREVSSLQRITSPRIAEILDADPHGPVPYVVTRYVPGLSLYHHVAEEGPVEGRDLLHFAGSLAEALAGGALGRCPAPRREADERPDGGSFTRPHRLRPGPRGRGPPAHPDRLAARHAGLPRSRDPLRRRRHRRLRRARLGCHRGLRGDRATAVRDGPGDGDHGPGTPRRARRERRTGTAARPAARGPLRRAAGASQRPRAARLGRRRAPPDRTGLRGTCVGHTAPGPVDDAVRTAGAHGGAARPHHRTAARASPPTHHRVPGSRCPSARPTPRQTPPPLPAPVPGRLPLSRHRRRGSCRAPQQPERASRARPASPRSAPCPAPSASCSS